MGPFYDAACGDTFIPDEPLECEECALRVPAGTEFTWKRVIESKGDEPFLIAFSSDGWTFGDVKSEIAVCPQHSWPYIVVG